MQPGQTIVPGGPQPQQDQPQPLDHETEVVLSVPRDVTPTLPPEAQSTPEPVVISLPQPIIETTVQAEPQVSEVAVDPTPSPTPTSSPDLADFLPATAEESELDDYQESLYQPQEPQGSQSDSVSWSASEFVAHQKSAAWFVGLGLILAVVAIGVYLVSHDFFSPTLIVILGIAFGIFAIRKPRVLQYSIDRRGIQIGEKLYTYASFKTFSVVEEGPLHSVLLAPLQRFQPPISIYYEPADEDQIVDALGNYLPFEEAKRDSIDSLMRRVRF